MTYTASEMRQRSEWLAGYAQLREQEIGSFAASQIKESAQMLRQAADAMEGRKVLDELGMYDIQRPK